VDDDAPVIRALLDSSGLSSEGVGGISHVSLFTESAVSFFERLGFRTVARSDLPGPVRTSTHASEECAESAIAMTLELRAP
jgi:N-acetylglutamate synthase-like GNAT family acetyltransferase